MCDVSECGVGGQSTSTSVSAPWHVGLFNAFGFLCSGVVVDHSWVLTAAHCLASHTYAPARTRLILYYSLGKRLHSQKVAGGAGALPQV